MRRIERNGRHTTDKGGEAGMVMNIVAIAFIAFVLYGMCKNDTEVENDGRINKAR